ncbi:MAG: hypothetical protein KGL39_25185 [Patescibacteria group bacterium]|nr:hypothetical protein [Patescibacteria group bacterium]
MTRYRKKSLEVEAWHFVTGNAPPYWLGVIEEHEGVNDVAARHKALNSGRVTASFGWRLLHIPTMEGVMTALVGDWIIRDVTGEIYPCKPNIFEATYERVDDQQ